MYKNQTSSAIKMKNQTMTILLSLNPSTRPLGRRTKLSRITPPPPPPQDFSDGEQYQRYRWYQSESSPVARSSEHPSIHSRPHPSFAAYAGIQNRRLRPIRGVLQRPAKKRRDTFVKMWGVLACVAVLVGLMACDSETDNPTNMKGRTITPARLPRIQPLTLPKVPASVREQLAGTNGRSRPATTSTQGELTHDPKTTTHLSLDHP